MAKKTKIPGEFPDTPEEIPVPEKMPEVKPPAVPESTSIPVERPDIFPEEEPFQPDIPTQIPPPAQ